MIDFFFIIIIIATKSSPSGTMKVYISKKKVMRSMIEERDLLFEYSRHNNVSRVESQN